MLAVTRGQHDRGPAYPYDHGGRSEVAMATEDVVAGEASIVVAGLRGLGYWCVQPRRNDVAVQITCQSGGRNVRVDVVAAPGGDLLHAYVDVVRSARERPGREPGDRLLEILDASLLRAWPEDRPVIERLVGGGRPSFMVLGEEAAPVDPEDQFTVDSRRTDDATWSVRALYTGDPLALQVSATSRAGRTWPFDGRHYATSVEDATTALVADGFTCGSSASSCFRDSDRQTVGFDEHDGQIVAVRFTLRSSAGTHDVHADPSGRWVRAGLPFLTTRVRAPIGRRVEEQRLAHRSWHGLVAGTPVDLRTVPGVALLPGDRPARDLMVTVGIPLVPVGLE